MDREAWWATVVGSQKSWTRLSDLTAMKKMVSVSGSEKFVQEATTWLLS